MRWLIALISDTGIRLGEAAGLEVSHIHLDEAIPYLTIEETDSRRLKTREIRRRCRWWGGEESYGRLRGL